MSWTLRTTLVIILSVTSVLAVAAAATVAVVQGRQDLREGMIDEQRKAGAGVAAAVASFLDEGGHSLASTAALLDEGMLRPQVDAKRVAAALDPLVAYSRAFEEVALVDASGNVLVARPAAGPWPDLAGDAALRRASADGAPALSLHGASPRWVAPVPVAGRPTYLLAGSLDLSQLRGLLFPAGGGGGFDLLLVDPQGAVLAATRPAMEGQSLAGWEPWAEVAGPDDGPDAPYAQGTPPGAAGDSFATRTPLRDADASIVVLSSTSALGGLTASLVGNAALTSLVMLALVLPAGVLVTSRVTRPVRKVEEATRRMRQGDLKARVRPAGARELRELAQGFNAMAGRLESEHEALLRMQGRLETQVAQRTAELQARNQDLESFAYIVSHDLRAPLRGLHFHLELLEESLGAARSGKTREAIDSIRARATRLAQMIDDVLEYSRKGRAPGSREEVAVGPLVAEVVAGLRVRKAFHVEAAAGLPAVFADRTQLLQVFQNLIGNALQHHDRGRGTVRISGRDRGADAEFTVEDDGPGIPSGDEERIFQIFFKAGSSGGSGIGLAIVRRIVEANGGRIRAEPTGGRGARFRFTWPKAGPRRGAPGELNLRVAPERAGAPEGEAAAIAAPRGL